MLTHEHSSIPQQSLSALCWDIWWQIHTVGPYQLLHLLSFTTNFSQQALVMSWEGARMKPSRWFIYPSLMSPLTGCFLLFFQESALFVFVVTGTLQIWAAGPNVDNKVWIFICRLSLLVLKTEGCRRGQVVQVTACRHCLSPCCSPTLRLNPPTC